MLPTAAGQRSTCRLCALTCRFAQQPFLLAPILVREPAARARRECPRDPRYGLCALPCDSLSSCREGAQEGEPPNPPSQPHRAWMAE